MRRLILVILAWMAILGLVAAGDATAFFRADAAAADADFGKAEVVAHVRDYMTRSERGAIEDWLVAKAKDVAAAGGAAHLPGVLASWTTLPVIGVPLSGTDLKGVDALYAIVQMPAGIPVATVAIGAAGVKNAAYLAAEILGLKHDAIRQAYDQYRAGLQGDRK